MVSAQMRIVFGLLTFVTVGMIIGALLQLAFLRRLEDSIGTEFLPAGRLHKTQYDSQRQLPRVTVKNREFSKELGGNQFNPGLPNWINDKEAEILRLGYECDYLKGIALPRLEISTVVDTKTGKGVKSDFRTSSGMFLSHHEKNYPMVQAIEKRISVYSQIPVENGELIQVLRYEKNQFYKPHHDYFSDTFNLKRGGQRIATMLMYLSENIEGGETYFPKAGSGECSCGGKTVPGLSVKPAKGDAILFWSMGLDGQSDPNSIHGGCEVLSGEKWSATKWMRQKSTLVP
ncbi:prolyl 4-hydroxylase 1 isoform X4 [Cucumis melo]|uniref:Prolyl 4-hydroxylase 1 isoform X4 n=1 Tax=Cucumis melo TaxID=3656 RepID=A0A1S4E033_CUCME|nr:prolyl 4-hydroxylase 1 isoform X4 [Cucumis melo]